MLEISMLDVNGTHGPAPEAQLAEPARGRGESRRYVLSDSLRRFLAAKYLLPETTAAGTAAVAGTAIAKTGIAASRMPGNRIPAAFPPVRSEAAAAQAGGMAGTPVHRAWAAVKLLMLAISVLLFAALAFVGEAHADSIVLAESGLVIGTQTDDFSFSAPSAGKLDVELTDFDWPAAMQSLSVSITSAMGTIGTMTAAGDATLTLDAGGTYYAHLMGQAAGQWDIGAYGLLGTFSPAVEPVPLPASVTLLLSGTLATLWSLRRRAARSRSVLAEGVASAASAAS